jgi:hypothetical protein
VERFGGFVAKYMGDGVLVYFGYPQAHEDDAERAVRAGLEAAASDLKTHDFLRTRESSDDIDVLVERALTCCVTRAADQGRLACPQDSARAHLGSRRHWRCRF